MADLQPTDEFLVNRDDTTYTQQQDTLMANLETTDYLLVNRSDATFKITGEDLINSVIDPLEIDAVLINPNLNIGDIAAVQVSLLGGKAPFSYVYQWKSTDADDNKTDIVGATASTYGIQEQDLGNRLSCEVTVTDSLDSEDTDETDLSNPVTAVEAVTKPTLIAPPDGAGLSDLTREGVFAESGAIQSVTQEGFSAVMDGLRFTPQRDTTMMSSAESFGGTFTLSLWIKPGAGGFDGTYDQNQYLFSNADPGTVGFNLASAEGSNILRFWNTSKHEVLSPDPLPEYTWSHVVITADHPKAELICYVNGVKKNTVNQSIEQQRAKIGVFDGIGSTIDGYASEWYFVDGQVLEPTDFGTADDGVWGPLDSSVILANIQAGEPSPYEQRPNMDEKWSDKVTGDPPAAGGEIENAFDGDESTQSYTASGDGKYSLFTTTEFPASDGPYIVEAKTYGGSYNLNNTVDVSANTFTETVSEFTTLKVNATSISGAGWYYIKVNGRILVDGPADNSENWSDRTSQSGDGWVAGRPISNIYSGRLDNSQGDMPGVNNGSGTVVFDPPITGSLIELNGSSSSNVVTINSGGTLALTDNSFSGTIWNDTGVTSLSQIDLVGSGSFATYIRAIRVDGELLVDSGEQWNTSQVWSDYGTGTPYNENYLWKYAFNGELNTTYWALAIDGTVYTWEPPTGVQFNNLKLKFVGELNPQIKLNGASYVEISSPGTGEWDYEITTPGTLEGLKLPCTKAAVYVGLKQITIDDEVLVDAASFGSNGFYLPFDASATGVNYSQHLSNASNPENAFKGNSDPTTALGVGSISPAGQTWLWQPVGLNGMTSLKIWSGTGGARDNGNIILNGADTGISSSGGLAERDLTAYITANNITTLTRLEINNTTSEPVSLLAVEYNGSVLVDHNNIGVDASGNGNNFHDENFAVGNTDQTWSTNVTVTNGYYTGSYPQIMFNGALNSGFAWNGPSNGVDGIMNCTFTDVNVVSKVRIRGYGRTSGATFKVTIGGAILTATATDTAGPEWMEFNGSGPLTLINATATDTYASCQAVEVDGVLLIDANIQDTVKDTPMTNYSTFKSNATDGNLIPTADGGNVSYKGESGTQYYYEKDGVGVIHEGGVSIAAETGVVYNFGQMSFAADNVTDNGDGTVTVDGVVYGTLFEELTSTATLTLADEGTLGLIPDGATPRMNATGNGAEGSYKSHTSTELVMNNIVGSWTTDSLTAKSVTEYSPAAPNPDDFTMVSSAYDATPEETALHGSTIWQVSDDPGFSAPVINEDTDVYLESFDTGGLQPETIYYGRVKHITVNGTSSPWSDVNTFKTATGEDPEPEAAKMSGLRFDENRATFLSTTLGQASTAGTVSVWIKVTDYGSYGYIWKTSNDLGLYIDTSSGTYNGKLAISASHYASGSPGTAYSTDTIPLNEWVNVVFRTGDGTNTAGMWINGVSQDNSTIDWTTGGFAITDGFTRIGEDNGDNYFNGYMSEFYCVDGQALEPTAFGEDIDGRWAPLGSSTIINNITRNESPYDQRPNMEQEWSATTTATGTYDNDISNVFDGNEDTNVHQITTFCKIEGFGITGSTVSFGVSCASGKQVKCIVNDTEFVQDAAPSGQQVTKWIDVPFAGGTLNSIKVETVDSKNRAALYLMKVDGRILVDGPADNSQNWSSYVSPGGGFDVQEPANAFNGSLSGLGWGGDSGVEYLMTIPGGIPCSSIRLYINSGGDYSPSDFLINGSQSINSSVGGTLQWTPATTVNGGTLNTIRFPVRKNNSDGWTVWAIEVDGAILVDSGAQWDTSQVWSSGTDPSAWGDLVPVKNLFDGNLSTYSYAKVLGDYQTVSWDAITANSSIRVYGRGTDDSWRVIVDDNPVSVEFSGNDPSYDSWRTLNTTFPCQVTGIQSNSPGAVYAIEVDGKVLVDAASFGDNGFYLPFDPEAQGVIYSSGVFRNPTKGTAAYNPSAATSQTGFAVGTIESVFDGDTSTVATASNDGTGRDWLYIKNLNITDVTRLRLWMRNSADVKINGTTITTTPSLGANSNVYQWKTVNTPPATITEIAIQGNNGSGGGGYNGSCGAVEVNGKILVDHNNIGVDASGNGNNFHDENFVVGKGASQVWSSVTTATGTYNGDIANLFDGDTETRVSHINPSIKIEGFNITGSTVSFGVACANGGQLKCIVNDTEFVQTNAPGGMYMQKWIDVPFAGGTLNSIEVVSVNSNNLGAFHFMKVDDQLLIDANMQDTVKDTPMTNYAVLDSGTNGNLVGSGTLTYTGEVGNTYYYETDDVGITAEAPVSNVGTGTHNFGQQPFAGSNVTDNGDGTVTIDGVVYNTLFQDFREWAGGFGYFYDAVNEKPVRGTTIADKYGLFRAEPRLGIHDLTEVPNYQVAGYERRGNQYQPIRSLAPELQASQAETVAAQAETAAAEAQADQYLNYLRAAACMWVVDKVYEAGDIINFNGQLYRATINAVATADTDPGDGTDRWEALNITAN